MTDKPAQPLRGYLLSTLPGDQFIFRVYKSADHSVFQDYKIKHCDLEIEIVDDCFAIYEDGNNSCIDYPPHVLKGDLQPKKLEYDGEKGKQ